MKRNAKLFVVLAVMLLVSQLSAWASDWEEFANVFEGTGWMCPVTVGDDQDRTWPWGSHPFALADDGNLWVTASQLAYPASNVKWKALDGNAWQKVGTDWELTPIAQGEFTIGSDLGDYGGHGSVVGR